MPRSAAALQIPLNDEPVVESIDDIDSCDLVYDDPEVVDMIEEERCPVSANPIGTHLYLDHQNHCCFCAMAAPWVRRDACRS